MWAETLKCVSDSQGESSQFYSSETQDEEMGRVQEKMRGRKV